jgi:hypothetical protein
VEVFDLNDSSGRLFAFEVDNTALTRRAVCHLVAKIPGCRVSRKPRLLSWFREDGFCEFQIGEATFVAEEEFGDNSRYYIGPRPPRSVPEIAVVRQAFADQPGVSRRIRVAFVVLFVALLLAILLGNLACDEMKACTTRGCTDQASIQVRRANGELSPLGVELEVDGRRVICGAPLRGGQARGACDDPVVFVVHRDLLDCIEIRSGQGVSLSCGPNGQTEQVITFLGTPQRVAVTLKAAGDVVAQQSFEFRYAPDRPNGDGCDPVCQQATESWLLP